MLTSTRRALSAERHSGRNRLALSVSTGLEQAGGMLAAPVVVVAVSSLLTADLVDMVVPGVAVSVAWIAGYAAVPVILSRARRLPWTIGASIVRAASLALLAYVLAGDDVSREQRLRSILICVAAYALAAGLARGASETLNARVTIIARHPRRSDALVASLSAALALLVGLASFTLLIDVPRAPLPRLSALFAVGAGLSGAATLLLGRVVESPDLSPLDRRPPAFVSGWRRQTRSLAWLAVSATSGAAELLLVVGLVRYMELPRAYLLSGLGAFLAASAVAAIVGGWVQRAVPFRAFIQVAAVLSGIAFALAIGLPTLLETDRAPETLLDRQPEEVGVWVAMALVGVAQQARRRVLPRLVEHTSTAPSLLNAAGFVLAFVPIPLAVLLERWEPRSWLLLGLGAALMAIAVSGIISPRRVSTRAARQTAVGWRTAQPLRSVGGRYGP